MTDVMLQRSRADPSLRHKGVNRASADYPEPVTKIDLQVAISIWGAFEDSACQAVDPAGSISVHGRDVAVQAANSPLVADFVQMLPSNYGTPLLIYGVHACLLNVKALNRNEA